MLKTIILTVTFLIGGVVCWRIASKMFKEKGAYDGLFLKTTLSLASFILFLLALIWGWKSYNFIKYSDHVDFASQIVQSESFALENGINPVNNLKIIDVGPDPGNRFFYTQIRFFQDGKEFNGSVKTAMTEPKSLIEYDLRVKEE